MISSVYYLLPPKRRMKQIFQGVGIIYALAIYYVHIKEICIFPEFLPIVHECKNEIGLLNLCITLFTMFYISNLYFFEMNVANEKLTYYSDHDLMTGLFNRRFFEHIMQRNKDENENKYTIAIFDIDDFKKVNDTYGHNCGDYILHRIAEMTQQICKDCVVCRWGGEEFVILSTENKDNKKVLEKLCKKIEDEELRFEEQTLRITVTIGVADYDNSRSNDLWISAADEKLYYGKNNGKNQVVE
jgi:diguanylate cyclase (GGDEF)-like protein